MERDRRGDQQPLSRPVGEEGQSTAEFAVIAGGFVSLVVALGVLWHAFGDGLIVKHALAVASHHIQDVAAVTLTDLFLY